MAKPGPASPPGRSTKSDDVPLKELAKKVGRTPWWLFEQIKLGRISHLRVGPPPLPGRRDTRPIYFTPEQAAEVEALAHHVEHVPASNGGAA